MRAKVKICGLRSVADVVAARGADAMGVLVLTFSARSLELTRARTVLSAVPQGTMKVVVTTCTDPEKLGLLVEELSPQLLQVHAELSPKAWEGIRSRLGDKVLIFGLLGVSDEPKEVMICRAKELRKTPLDGVVLDTKCGEKVGGTGKIHDWGVSLALREILRPLSVMLAGGLNPGNVREAIRRVSPDWVDVSSGVEEKGRKSPYKIREFLKAVRDEAF